jgi:hypothetical protein
MTLKSRIARLEERAGLSQIDDEFLGLVGNEAKSASEGVIRVEDPRERHWRGAQTILATMSEEDQAFVLDELAHRPVNKCPVVRDPTANNLLRQYLLMAELLFRDDDPPVRRYGLPPEVANIYRNYPLATAQDECRDCGYFSPCLLWTGNPTDPGPKAATALKLPLHSGFNCFQFFTRCPLCGGSTGSYSEPYYQWQEHRRVLDETKRMREEKSVDMTTT